MPLFLGNISSLAASGSLLQSMFGVRCLLLLGAP